MSLVQDLSPQFPSEVRIKAAGVTLSGKYKDQLSDFTPADINPATLKKLTEADAVLKKDMEALIQTAVHPDIENTFHNPIRSHTAYNTINNEDLLSLINNRGKYAYIDQAVIPHHPHIGKHVFAVASVAMAIGSVLKLTSAGIKSCISRALLHDGSKIPELLTERMNELKINPETFGLRKEHTSEDIMRAAGVSEEFISRLNEAAGLTGHLSIPKFTEVTPGGILLLREGMLIEKIVHLADDLVSESSVMPLNDRMIKSKFPEKYAYLWQSGIKNTGCYADLQVMTTEAISAEFLIMLGLPVTNTPNRTLTEMIVSKLRQLNLAA